MKHNILIVGFVLAVSLLSGCALSGPTAPPVDSPGSSAEPIDTFGALTPPVPNETGYIDYILPQSLLGGKSAESYQTEYLAEADSELYRFCSGVKANPDGSVSMLFTPAEFERFKADLRSRLWEGDMYEGTSITGIECTGDYAQEITIFVTGERYPEPGTPFAFDRTLANTLTAMNAGMYQIACGVSPGEWQTVITVKDDKTGETFSRNEFPSEDMYKSY